LGTDHQSVQSEAGKVSCNKTASVVALHQHRNSLEQKGSFPLIVGG